MIVCTDEEILKRTQWPTAHTYIQSMEFDASPNSSPLILNKFLYINSPKGQLALDEYRNISFKKLEHILN